jgi:hypothetical protein
MVNIFLTFCAFFPSFISNTSIVSINFGANLDAQNAENGIPVLQISKILWGSTPPDPPFMRDMLATHVTFSHCYPPLIYYLTERSLFKKCPPTGKSLKKALEINLVFPSTHVFFCLLYKGQSLKSDNFYRKAIIEKRQFSHVRLS